MALFLSAEEKGAITANDRHPRVTDFHWALLRRVEQRASKPGLLTGDETADWWYPAAEYLTDAAMAQAIKADAHTAIWLRDVTLSLVRRPQDDWVGPDFRNHTVLPDGSQIGHLETAHFTWATALVLDLAPGVFTIEERREVAEVLRNRGVAMCLNWLDRPHSVANWWCVMTAGLTVAAAVLDDQALLTRARKELADCAKVLQEDGSHGESLQYANYALYSLMLSCEALRRRGENIDQIAPLGRQMGYARWAAASYLYSRPTTGWGPAPKPRSFNFNDSGAVFKPTADLLLYLATRGKASHPKEAGLARWLFEETYAGWLAQGPHDQASFGLRTDWGFLTLPLLPQAAAALSPTEADLDATQSFDCGDAIARDDWHGKTVLAVRGGGPPLHGPGHLHHDLNSLILVHNQQRLLTDAGHGCYRNLIRQLDVSTGMHNTCVFHVTSASNDSYQAPATQQVIEQRTPPQRHWNHDRIDPPVDRGARRLIAAQCDDLRVLASEASAAYGPPITRFARFTILCGAHVVFVIDHIKSDQPVYTQWNWLLNNRDGELDLELAGPDRIVARRGDAGMKLFSLSGGRVTRTWAHVHDAYHTQPGQMGEGRPGSGHLLHWREPNATTERMTLHAIALDGYGEVARWHLRSEANRHGLESAGGTVLWTVESTPQRITIREEKAGRVYHLTDNGQDVWSLVR